MDVPYGLHSFPLLASDLGIFWKALKSQRRKITLKLNPNQRKFRFRRKSLLTKFKIQIQAKSPRMESLLGGLISQTSKLWIQASIERRSRNKSSRRSKLCWTPKVGPTCLGRPTHGSYKIGTKSEFLESFLISNLWRFWEEFYMERLTHQEAYFGKESSPIQIVSKQRRLLGV